MASSIKLELTSIVTNLLGRNKLDAKTMQYWEQYITQNLSTLEDFTKMIYNEPIFQVVVRAKFEAVCESYNLAPDSGRFTQFWESNEKHNMTTHCIQTWVAHLPEFVSAWTEVIGNTMIYELGGDADLGAVSFYLARFADVAGYDILALGEDIRARAHVPALIVEVPVSANINGIFIESVFQTVQKTYDQDYVEGFEETFQRPMYVQEYFKYLEKQESVSWPVVFTGHHNSFNRLREIFESFTGKTISEYYFVSKFLNQVDDMGFFDNIIDSIVNSGEYTNNMQKILAEKYKSMYDQTLSEADIAYVFDIVKKQKLDVVNDQLAVVLTNLKDETDEIISHVFKQFIKILQRPPDIYDIELYIKYYRDNSADGYARIDGRLETILMHTLEFHDIIKKKIKVVYSEKNGKEILPSMMFDVLNRVLVKIDGLTMENLEGTIGEFLG